jgi:hypothetical protein
MENDYKIKITKSGYDGFGHQLHGLFTLMVLHNIQNYYFDAYSYIETKFDFEHIKTQEEKNLLKNYLIEINKLFIEYFKSIKYNNYNKSVIYGEIINIPKQFDNNTLYKIDNNFFFNKKLKLNIDEKKQYNNNIQIIQPFFINKFLPYNRLNDKNIVIHIRLGDINNSRNRNNYCKNIVYLIKIFKRKYNDYQIYIHSNGNLNDNKLKDLNKDDFIFFDKNTPVLQSLSDFIYAKIFVCDYSSLSTVSTLIKNKELIIIEDTLEHNLLYNCVTISNYIKNNNI